MTIFLILALSYLLGAVLEVATKKQLYPRVSQRLGLKYVNTQGNSYTGTMDQQTFTKWKNKGVIRKKVANMGNPQSAKQTAVRQGMKTFVDIWNDPLQMTEANKALWEMAGKIIPQPNPESGVRAIIRRSTSQQSGLNAFIAANQRALQVGAITPIITPLVHSKPANITDLAISWISTGVMKVDWVAAGDAVPQSMTRIWVAFRTAKIAHKQMLVAVSEAAGTASIVNFNGALGEVIPFESIVGAELYVQADVVRQDSGEVSDPSNTVVTTVTIPTP